MGTPISIEAAGPRLREALEHMPEGETLEIVDSGGEPMALLVSLRPSPGESVSAEEWLVELDALAERISKAWKSDRSAVEIISEMRR